MHHSLVLLSLVCILTCATCETLSHSTFFISPQQESSKSISLLTSLGKLATCKFHFSTNSPSSPTALTSSNSAPDASAATSTTRADAQNFLGRLSGVCIRKQIGYWKYELCFEGSVTQSHGGSSNSLGNYKKLDGTMQLYENGTPCEALSDFSGRRSRIEFVCDKELRIRSVLEESTCSYKLVVGAPIVCGHPDFRTVSDGDGSEEDASHSEPWFFELMETDGGQVVCSAYSTKSDAQRELELLHKGKDRTESLVQFKAFSLVVDIESAKLSTELHMCRGPGRKFLSRDDGEYVFKQTDRRVALESGNAYKGGLEFVTVQAKPTN